MQSKTHDQKKAKLKKLIQEYVSNRGIVDGVEPGSVDNHPGHDYIFVKLPDGRHIKISNNTELGKKILPAIGSELTYHGYQIPNTNIVHKVHPNKSSRGGWLEA